MSKPSLASLLEKAAKAPPPERASKSNWACFYPVVRQLIAGGRNVIQSVEWLIENAAIEKAKREKAYRALLYMHQRHTAKKSAP